MVIRKLNSRNPRMTQPVPNKCPSASSRRRRNKISEQASHEALTGMTRMFQRHSVTRLLGDWSKHFWPARFTGAERHRRRLAKVAELKNTPPKKPA